MVKTVILPILLGMLLACVYHPQKAPKPPSEAEQLLDATDWLCVVKERDNVSGAERAMCVDRYGHQFYLVRTRVDSADAR